jgi:hypothetical protein
VTAPRRRWSFTLRTLFVALTLLACWLGYRHWSQRFDGESWRSDPGGRLGVRLTMADGLIARCALRKLSRRAVIQMLGEPVANNSFAPDGWDTVYLLGEERGLGIDHEWLAIRFDKTGNVEDYRIVTD